MARVKKASPTLETIFFSTPEQKVMRLLIAEPTTVFTPRVISSKLKGVRGLGGADGIMSVLMDLQTLGMVDFVDNHRAVRLQDDNTVVQILKRFAAICDLENLRKLLEPVSTKGILFGSRASGKARSDSNYDLLVVSESPEEVKKIAARHPMAKDIELTVLTPEQHSEIQRKDPAMSQKIAAGIVIWGPVW